jgi:hypothetical protein
VCRGCGWNHLVEQFLLGRATGEPPVDPVAEPAARGRGAGRSGRAPREAAE